MTSGSCVVGIVELLDRDALSLLSRGLLEGVGVVHCVPLQNEIDNTDLGDCFPHQKKMR